MRVLLYTLNYAELAGIGKYTREMAEWLGEQGVEVTVVTAPPYYPAWRVEAPYSATRYQEERTGKVSIIRCPLFVPRRATALKRILHLLSFAFTSLPVVLWHALRCRPQLIMVVEPPLFAAPCAWLAARICGATAWLHVQDFEVETAFNLGLLRKGALHRLVVAAESWLMRRFDRVSTISARMRTHLLAKNIEPDRIDLFPNWVELERIRPLGASSRLRTSDYAPGDIVVLYSGNLGKKQGLETVIEAATLLNEPGDEHIRFIICGDGVERMELEALAQDSGNIAFWPLVPLKRLNELLNLADIHVLPQRRDAADLVFPSKLANMLASGRPVVATANPGTEIATVLHGCGVVVAPGNAPALAHALRSLANDPQRRHALGVAARHAAERRWDKNKVLEDAFRAYFAAHSAAGRVAPQTRAIDADAASTDADLSSRAA